MQKTMTFTNQIPTLPQIHPPNLTNTKNPPQISHLFHLKPIKIQPLSLNAVNCTGGAFQQVISRPPRECECECEDGDVVVGMRLGRLVSEFRALSEPIDRVKRLLGYASVLPRIGDSTRSPENRVRGCAAQVWLEVVRDEFGRMRFGADSDSEITKGFCSCLIFLLDGAYPKDVLKVKAEDLTDMNVGLPVRSRVNSWHNVLVNMQERTKQFLPEKDQEVCQTNDSVDAFPSLVVPHDSIVSKGEVCVS